MRARITNWSWKLIAISAGCQMLQSGCIRDIQQEMEVLFAPEAAGSLLNGSWVVNNLGAEFLSFFTKFW